MYQPISSLCLPEYKIQELQLMGYNYCKDVNILDHNSKPKLLNSSEWSTLTCIPKTKSALDFYQEECIAGNIITFNKELDDALGGGIPLGRITEFCGEPGSGKTQICFQLSVNVQLPSWCGGMAGKALYISTNKGFASHRLREVATACVSNYKAMRDNHFRRSKNSASYEFDVDSILKSIYYLSVIEYVEFISITKYLKTWLKNHPQLRLLVIDSIVAPLRLLNGTERTQTIYSICSDLQKLAQNHGFAIVLTNDVTTRISATNSVCRVPSLGGSYYHRINIRVQLAKTSDRIFKASVLKNVLKPPTDVEFQLFC